MTTETEPATGNSPHWLTRKEAARRAGVSVRTIDRWTQEGHLTRHRTNIRSVRINAGELEEKITPKGEGA